MRTAEKIPTHAKLIAFKLCIGNYYKQVKEKKNTHTQQAAWFLS